LTKPLIRKARNGEIELREFALYIFKRCLKDWDIFIGICGEEGVGKSTLAVLIAWYIDNAFSVKKNVIGSPNVREVSEHLLHKLPKRSPVILDEAIKLLYKLGWQTAAQILINTVFSVCRARNHIVLLCMPRFLDFNEYNRQHRVKIWVEVVERGHAFVFIKDKSPFITDSWHIKDNQKVMEKYLKRKKIADIEQEEYFRALRETITFAGEFHFGLMPDEVVEDYNELKKQVRKDFDVTDEVKGVAKLYRNAAQKAVKILYTELALKQAQISSELGISIYTVNRMLQDEGVRRIDKVGAKTLK